MSAIYVGVGLAVAGGVSSYQTGKTNAYNSQQAGNYNAAATLANGKTQAAATRFDAIGPSYQAKMEGVSSRLNATIFEANAKMTRFGGDARTADLLLQSRYAIEDSSAEAEASMLQAYESAKERGSANSQFQQDISDIEVEGAKRKALAKAAFASMGISVDSGSLEAIDNEIDINKERDAGRVMLARTIENLSLGKSYKTSTTQASSVLGRGVRESDRLKVSASVAESETSQAVLAAEIEAQKLANSGAYMDWYSEFITERAEIQARTDLTGASIRADNALIVAAADSANYKGQGTAGLITGLGSAGSQFSSYKQFQSQTKSPSVTMRTDLMY